MGLGVVVHLVLRGSLVSVRKVRDCMFGLIL